MLDAPSDVFSFMINPSDPHLVCGGCANGQVALWDLGRTYYELRARTQDRKKKNVNKTEQILHVTNGHKKIIYKLLYIIFLF